MNAACFDMTRRCNCLREAVALGRTANACREDFTTRQLLRPASFTLLRRHFQAAGLVVGTHQRLIIASNAGKCSAREVRAAEVLVRTSTSAVVQQWRQSL